MHVQPHEAPVRIAVFARAPVPGAAKTRLISALGAAGAARLHRRLVLDTLGTAIRADVGPVSLWCAPDAGHRFFRAIARRCGISPRRQHGTDLGARMAATLQALLPEGPAVLVGTDCPALAVAHLQLCADALRGGQDAVVLPAEDGGYVAIGFARQLCGAVFDAMPWGSTEVMSRTRMRLAAAGCRWSEPATLWDVDRPEDLARLAALRGAAASA
jgi:rSAM/selenodomain-associated transferase 1